MKTEEHKNLGKRDTAILVCKSSSSESVETTCSSNKSVSVPNTYRGKEIAHEGILNFKPGDTAFGATGVAKKDKGKGDVPSISAIGSTHVTAKIVKTSKEAESTLKEDQDTNVIKFDDGSGRRKKKKRRYITICLTKCRYEIVRQVSRRYGLLEVPEDSVFWNIYWTDYSISIERAMDMKPFQIVNHFPGMNEICRKDLLARNLNRMKRIFPEEYKFFPKSWCLPADNAELMAYASTRRGRTYICKPEMGCQGRGIFLVRNVKDLNPFGKMICQVYVQRPFLIDGLKFDLRIYVLITSCDPLRIYVYKEGLARFATTKYKAPTNNNQDNSFMHLTNYAVNKYSEDFVVDDTAGSKRRFSTILQWLTERDYDTQKLLNDIDDAILKTMFSALPSLRHNYNSCFPHHELYSACFEILGFDVLLDQELNPYVIEVNHSPSFHTDSKLDLEIKEGLLDDTFAMLNVRMLDRRKIEAMERKRIQERLMQKTNEQTKLIQNAKEAAADRTRGPSTINKLNKFHSAREPILPVNNGDTLLGHDAKFKWEIDHIGQYRLIYPLPHTDSYDKFLFQNNYSLYMETTASQARTQLTKTLLEENNLKRLEEERKRAGIKEIPGPPISKAKVRPESPLVNTTNGVHAEKKKKKVPKTPYWKKENHSRGFDSQPIISDEECARVKSMMQRGMLIRSLGIEVQCYNLLCSVGHLKPKDHENFRRRNGYVTDGKPMTVISRQDAPACPSGSSSPRQTSTLSMMNKLDEITRTKLEKTSSARFLGSPGFHEVTNSMTNSNNTARSNNNNNHIARTKTAPPMNLSGIPWSFPFTNQIPSSLFARRWQADKNVRFALPRIPK